MCLESRYIGKLMLVAELVVLSIVCNSNPPERFMIGERTGFRAEKVVSQYT